MSRPIIFFHANFDPYLVFSVRQALRSNPQAPVWLIGDSGNDLSQLGVRHFLRERYAGRREAFVGIYRSFTNHEAECERLCFERWFHLESVLEETDTQEFCFLDSDYLLLDCIADRAAAWRGFEIAGAIVWAFGWFVRRRLISEFCNYMLERFQDAAQLSEWERRFKAKEDMLPPWGIFNVCDMTLWLMFIRDRGIRHLNLAAPRDGLVFDSGITSPDGFRMRGGLKELVKRPEGYFGFLEKNGAAVRFAGLHLNGKYPKRLGPLFAGWSWPAVRSSLRPNYVQNFRKLVLIASYSWQARKVFSVLPSPELAA